MSFYKKVLPAALAMLTAGYALNRHFSLAFGGRLNAWDFLTKNLNLEIGVGGWAGGYVFYERK